MLYIEFIALFNTNLTNINVKLGFMEYDDVNIGLLIEQRVNELNLNKSEFARRLGIANQNINAIFGKESINTDRLAKIGEALDYDFFAHFRPKGEERSGQPAERKETSCEITETHGNHVSSLSGNAHAEQVYNAPSAQQAEAARQQLADKQQAIDALKATVKAQQTTIALLQHALQQATERDKYETTKH